MVSKTYDVAIVGSGIAGSVTALCLSRAGIKTLVVERKTHPRFAIGESTGPTTTLGFRFLSRTYDIPELQMDFLRVRSRGCPAWPKQHFWFGHHTEGEPLRTERELLAETPRLPGGPDTHMLRSFVDENLVSLFPKYGVDYLDLTEVKDFAVDDEGALLKLEGEHGGHDVRAKMVVDASGHASFFAQKFGMRDEAPRFTTNTRCIFGHFKNLEHLDEAVGGFNPFFRFHRNAGTMHHCFRGGWIWVIPFDNGITSVGATLDREEWPLNPDVPVEEELAALIRRFPSVDAHLGKMEPVRPLVRTDRIQFTSKTILGDRLILTPHASGFIDPLLSSGILLTTAFVARFVPAMKRALEAGDFSKERFQPIEDVFFRETRNVDNLVGGAIASFRDFELYKSYRRTWLFAEVAQLGYRVLTDHGETDGLGLLYGTGNHEFTRILAEMRDVVGDKSRDPKDTAALINERMDSDELWSPWHPRYSEDNGSCHALAIPSEYEEFLAKVAEQDKRLPRDALKHYETWKSELKAEALQHLDDYRHLGADSDFRISIDRILSVRTPWFERRSAELGTPPGVEELIG